MQNLEIIDVFILSTVNRKDTIICLEEAFRAGHGAADATCLHYCHNLWSSLRNKPYTDAIVTVTKEVDNNMAYLHSLNVIANAFDYHYQRQPPEEVLYVSSSFCSINVVVLAGGLDLFKLFAAQILLNNSYTLSTDNLALQR